MRYSRLYDNLPTFLPFNGILPLYYVRYAVYDIQYIIWCAPDVEIESFNWTICIKGRMKYSVPISIVISCK